MVYVVCTNNIKYSDDTVVFTKYNMLSLRNIVNIIVDVSGSFSLSLNTNKTKNMVISKNKV